MNVFLNADTVSIGGSAMPTIDSKFLYPIYSNVTDAYYVNKNVKCIIFREGVKEISKNVFYVSDSRYRSSDKYILESVKFPKTLKTIGENAFYYCTALTNVNSIDSLTELGAYAFAETNYKPEVVYVPKNLKCFHFSSLPKAKEYFFSEKIQSIGNRTNVSYMDQYFYTYYGLFIQDYDNITLHCKTENPPTFLYDAMTTSWNQFLKNSTVYVPKKSISNYKKSGIPTYYATVLAEPNPATSISLDYNSLEIIKINSKQLSATVLPEDADSKTFTWSSSDTDIATVSSEGLVTGIRSGRAVIYATLNSDNTIKDCCIVKVYQPVSGIHLNIQEKSLKVGETYTLLTTVNPNDADNKNIIWTSENSEIATVENSVVTAVKAGTVKITATSEDNANATDVCVVTVLQPTIGITLNQSSCTLSKTGETVQLEATVTPEDASDKSVTWKSSNDAVCIVSNGLVVATGMGTAVVVATTVDGGYMAFCTITISETTGIDSIKSQTVNSSTQITTIDGRQTNSLNKGVNIIRKKDGSTTKVIK